MGYYHVDPADLEPEPDRPGRKLSIGDACGLGEFAAHVFEVDPGEEIPPAYHSHDEHEELFHVTEGALHVESPDRDYRIGVGEAFGVESESPQLAFVPEGGAPAVDDVHASEP